MQQIAFHNVKSIALTAEKKNSGDMGQWYSATLVIEYSDDTPVTEIAIYSDHSDNPEKIELLDSKEVSYPREIQKLQKRLDEIKDFVSDA
jgi:hypothetical protein